MSNRVDLLVVMAAFTGKTLEPGQQLRKLVLTEAKYDRCVARFGAEETARFAVRAPPLPLNEAEPPRS